MVRLSVRKVSVDSFFEFVDGTLPFDLVDVVNEVEANTLQDFERGEGVFAYKTKFLVNQPLAARLGATGVRFEIFTRNPRTNNLAPSDAIETFEVRFDTAQDVITRIGGQNRDNTFSARMPPNSVKKVLVSHAAPVNMFSSLIVPSMTSIQPGKSFKQISNEMKSNGEDPAHAASAGNFSAVTPGNAISLGFTNNFFPVDGSIVGSSGVRAPRTSRSLFSLRNFHRKLRRNNQSRAIVKAAVPRSDANSAKSIVSFFKFLSVKREYVQTIYLGKHEVMGAENLYATVTAISSPRTKRMFSKTIVEIKHGTELSEFLANPEPPEVSLINSGVGFVSIRLKKIDPTLKTVRVFRIITNPNMNTTSVLDVSDLSFSADDIIIFDDSVDNVRPNKVIYRFAVVNGDGSIGEFSSIVMPSFHKVHDSLLTATVPIAIRARNTHDAVEIRIIP